MSDVPAAQYTPNFCVQGPPNIEVVYVFGVEVPVIAWRHMTRSRVRVWLRFFRKALHRATV